MKIFIPTNDHQGLNSTAAEHFGRCKTYTVLDQKGRVQAIINNTSEHLGGAGLPPELIKRKGADVLLCKELGPKALDLCSQLGIEVYVCPAQTVREIFGLWKNKQVKKAQLEDSCQKH
jgi:predicted Fe-Mo cluster-binding NifX family protein